MCNVEVYTLTHRMQATSTGSVSAENWISANRAAESLLRSEQEATVVGPVHQRTPPVLPLATVLCLPRGPNPEAMNRLWLRTGRPRNHLKVPNPRRVGRTTKRATETPKILCHRSVELRPGGSSGGGHAPKSTPGVRTRGSRSSRTPPGLCQSATLLMVIMVRRSFS